MLQSDASADDALEYVRSHTMPTLAIVGAGPGMGLAIARTFGRNGFTVALLASDQAKLDTFVAQLADAGTMAPVRKEI
jgi:NAD(P)-dependent dehydrogenase (short-subunit alcohol dehydrogenase family)